jgi:hypothetical protein
MPRKDEEWIKGFDGLYTISREGVVRTYKTGRGCLPPGTPLVQSLGTKGYPQVRLYDSFGKGFSLKVHRIVAETFIENPEKLQQVDHINNNKIDNGIQNLRWVTNQTNTFKELSKTYYLLKKDGTGVFVKGISTWCRMVGIDCATLFKMKKGERKSAYGFVHMEEYCAT